MHGEKGVAQANQPSRNRVVKANRNTFAAKWNANVLRGLQDALTKNPEVDLTTLLPPTYPKTLQSHKTGITFFMLLEYCANVDC